MPRCEACSPPAQSEKEAMKSPRLPFKTVSSTTSSFPTAMATNRIAVEDIGMAIPKPKNSFVVKDGGKLENRARWYIKPAVIILSLITAFLMTAFALQIWHGVKSDRSLSQLQKAINELIYEKMDLQPKDKRLSQVAVDGKITDHWNVTGLQDCEEYRAAGYSTSGLYLIHPLYGRSTGYVVYCDMDTDGGGWRIFQRRVDGSVYFYRNWLSYQHGFGNASHEFWIGNDVLHNLTSFLDVRLRVDMWAWDGEYAYAEFSNFSVKAGHYQLVFGDFLGGPAGNGLERQNMTAFSTYDNIFEEYHRCPRRTLGAWWYGYCYQSNLNGPYNFDEKTAGGNGIGLGLIWNPWKGDRYSLRKTEMKFRRTK